MNNAKTTAWLVVFGFIIAIPAFAQGTDTSMRPGRCNGCSTETTRATRTTAPAPQAAAVPDTSSPYQHLSDEQLAAEIEAKKASRRTQMEQEMRELEQQPAPVAPPAMYGQPQFPQAPAVIRAANPAPYGPPPVSKILQDMADMGAYWGYGDRVNPNYNYGYARPGFYGGGYNPAMYGYYGINRRTANLIFEMQSRDPRHLQTHGLLKIDGPDGFLKKVRILVNGADVGIASKHNNWYNEGIPIPAGDDLRIDFIHEEPDQTTTVTREKVMVPSMAQQLAHNGRLAPTILRISYNDLRVAQRQGNVVKNPKP